MAPRTKPSLPNLPDDHVLTTRRAAEVAARATGHVGPFHPATVRSWVAEKGLKADVDPDTGRHRILWDELETFRCPKCGRPFKVTPNTLVAVCPHPRCGEEIDLGELEDAELGDDDDQDDEDDEHDDVGEDNDDDRHDELDEILEDLDRLSHAVRRLRAAEDDEEDDDEEYEDDDRPRRRRCNPAPGGAA